ncbi:MAG: SAM-dependent chlorinase/fluorinase [Pirellulaceae bacterium]
MITLTTDFGVSSPYVAQMKGVLLTKHPFAQLVDITHAVPAQHVLAGAIFLQEATAWFPPAAIHIGVVDPGVGTERPVIAARTSRGYVVGPDNGLFSLLDLHDVVRLDRAEFWNARVSSTFHGRDIMAPVAAALGSGVPLDDLGTRTSSWQQIALPAPQIGSSEIIGEILFADSFGNLMTNICEKDLDAPPAEVQFAGETFRFVQTYGQAEPGQPVVLIGSSGRLELAIVNGNAAKAFDGGGEIRIEL